MATETVQTVVCHGPKDLRIVTTPTLGTGHYIANEFYRRPDNYPHLDRLSFR